MMRGRCAAWRGRVGRRGREREKMKKGPRVLGFQGPREERMKTGPREQKAKSDTEITEGGLRYTEKRGRGMKEGTMLRAYGCLRC